MFSVLRVLVAVQWLILAGCGGIPIASMSYLASMGPRLLSSNPAELSVALLHDQQLPLAPDAAPVLQIKIEPRVAGAFPVVDEKMRLIPAAANAKVTGLRTAPADMRWRIYVLSAAQAERVAQIQENFRKLSSASKSSSGGSAAVGVSMDALTPPGSAEQYDAMRLESWLRISMEDSFVKLWSGRMEELRKAAKKAKVG